MGAALLVLLAGGAGASPPEGGGQRWGGAAWADADSVVSPFERAPAYGEARDEAGPFVPVRVAFEARLDERVSTPIRLDDRAGAGAGGRPEEFDAGCAPLAGLGRDDGTRLDRVMAVGGEEPATDREPRILPLGRTSATEDSSESWSGATWPEAAEIDPGATLQGWAEGAGLLVAISVVLLWLVRQWVWKRTLPGGAAVHLRNIESLSLPQRCRVHLVEVSGRHVLVACDAGGLKSVTVLPERFDTLLPGDVEPASEAARTAAAEWTARREATVA